MDEGLPPLPIDDFVNSFYSHIAHGDEDHRAWLKRETQAWFYARKHLFISYAEAAVLQERERCAKLCDEIERKQDNDNGAANTGGAAECAAAIRAAQPTKER